MNLDIAYQALERIKVDPDRWNQQSWRCTSGMCFAGHVAEVAGAIWELPPALMEGGTKDEHVIAPSGEVMHVRDFAIKALDIPDDMFKYGDATYELFWAHNTLEDLEEALALVASGKADFTPTRPDIDWDEWLAADDVE